MFIKLMQWDKWLFFKINSEWTNAVLDHNYPWWRESITWYPLYLFLFVFSLLNFGRKAWLWILTLVINVTLTDQISSSVIKAFVHRTRPCHDAAMAAHMRMLLNHCSGGFSFPSSHATNHFGAAVFLHSTLHSYLGNWSYLFFFWAATVSYGQVYVGVHYPVDVIGGAVIGSLVGFVTAAVFKRTAGIPPVNTA